MNMSLNFHHLLLILTILLAFAYLQTDASVGRKDSPQEDDDWKDIDPNNPKVVEYAKFAVDEYNKQIGINNTMSSESKTVFNSVHRAQMNRVRDFNANLRIFLQASDGKYLDSLWLKPLEDNKEEEEKRRREGRGRTRGKRRKRERGGEKGKDGYGERKKRGSRGEGRRYRWERGLGQLSLPIPTFTINNVLPHNQVFAKHQKVSLNCHTLLIPTILFLANVVSFAKKDTPQQDDWKDIDVNNPKVVESAKFAIDEENKGAHFKLVLKSVLKAQVQNLGNNDLKLRIFIEVSGDKYVAIILLRPANDSKKLILFEQIFGTIN
ncbi:hypothetical protein ACH5RR_014691 [Cinchona calisaya]|uniref:Cystatin domain-containing protein n=1 Tax=Cinchona calisaya TaxID=153742 RepID=A0ABD2ZTQ5_9GENT